MFHSPKDSALADETFLADLSPLQSLNRLLYDELIKSILKIIEKLDLLVLKQNINEGKVRLAFEKKLKQSIILHIILFFPCSVFCRHFYK